MQRETTKTEPNTNTAELAQTNTAEPAETKPDYHWKGESPERETQESIKARR